MLAFKKKHLKPERIFFKSENKRARSMRPIRLDWRFILPLALLLAWLNLFISVNWVKKYIMADSEAIGTVGIYAFSHYAENDGEDPLLGWYNGDKAVKGPDVGPFGGMLSFSDENSAYYSGGSANLVLENFNFLSQNESEKKSDEKGGLEDGMTGEETEVSEDENAETGAAEAESEAAQGEEDPGEDFIDPGLPAEEAPSDHEDAGAGNAEEGGAGPSSGKSDDPEEGNGRAKAEDIGSEPEILESSSGGSGVEIIENEGAADKEADSAADVMILEDSSVESGGGAAGSAEVPNPNETGTEDGPISMMVGGLLGARSVQAQDFYSEEVRALEDFGEFQKAEIKLSLAKALKPRENEAQPLGEGKIAVWYSLEDNPENPEGGSLAGRLWSRLAELDQEDINNQSNSGYLSFEADFLKGWDDARRLKLRFEAVGGEDSLFYLDSAWIEAEYDRTAILEKIKKRERWANALQKLEFKTVLRAGEKAQFRFRYQKSEQKLWETLAGAVGLGDYWHNVSLSAKLLDSRGREAPVKPDLVLGEDGEFSVSIADAPRGFRPGEYRLVFSILDESSGESEEMELSQRFDWGVLAFNFDKSEYQTGNEGYLQFGVLDSNGHTICDAELEVAVRKPDGSLDAMKTDSEAVLNKIQRNPECGPDNVIDTPDYYGYYVFDLPGDYEFTVKAITPAGEKSVSETISVKDSLSFDIKREGPTRIWPKADYVMRISMSDKNDFSGDIIEVVPKDFKISNFSARGGSASGGQFSIDDSGEGRRLVIKDVTLKAGEVLEISYTFDAPDITPELFLLGPLETQIENRKSAIENRSWQIASDSFAKRAKTVMFQAGVYNDVAAGTGQNTNTDYTLAGFNWKLAESGVTIKNAYIVMETQFEAYNTTGIAYSGYKLGFDACEETCTAAAFGVGGGQVLEDNANTVVYDDTESNIGRFLLDVTNETQLAGYTGNGVLMESQFGYRLKNSSAYSSIANASAMLVVTYTYDIDSPSITNTVTYPLDSTNGTDNGSRQALQGACTADSNCPTFAYNMELPEWQGVATSSNRVSQWLKLFAAPQNNTTTDLRPYVDIQTFNVDSTDVFHFEEALSGNGNTPPIYFPDWANSGYAENASQQIEYYVNTTNYVLGGEVSETYIASSSAPIKTRTVSYPIGVISNGNTTALSNNSVNIFFPENGSATGTVDIKSAWVRLTIHGHTTSNTTYTATVSTKSGNNATSSNLVYNYRAPVTVSNPVTNIVHIIPSIDYTELEGATATSSKEVKVNLTYSNAVFNGASAELMITYSYSEESYGYLSSHRIFGGQQSSAPATSTTLSTANSVLPEATGKSMLAAGLVSHYLTSDNAAAMGTGAYLSSANLSASEPDCSAPAYRAVADSVNLSGEMISAVTSAMDTTDNQAYYACYARDNTGLASDVNKMNGQLAYTYGWTNSRPTGSFNSAAVRRDAGGTVDIEIEIDDADDHDVRAKLEFATGTACVFSPSGDPALDETDANITADYADPYIENDNPYQIGTPSGYIKTASGSNSVSFDWLSRESLGAVDGAYCLRLTASDSFADQSAPATTTVYIDTTAPTAPGALSLYSRTGTSVTLNFGATTTENNFNEYKIFYKQYDGTDPKETDSMWASTSDINLYDKYFNNKATTTINVGLVGSTTYSFAIWAYDAYGNKASSSRVDIMTNDAPVGAFNAADTKQKSDGSGVVDISIEADDANDHDQIKAKIEYVEGAGCVFSPGSIPTLDESPANVTADFGSPLPSVENDNEYQVGNINGWIKTSPGSNTVTFDWFGRQNEPSANGTYCLRLTLHDGFDVQLQSATTLVTLDNVKPSSAGPLSSGGVTHNSINLAYNTASPGSDTNEPNSNAYRIFYKKAQSGATMNDTEIDNTDLDGYDYNGATSTLISGLDQDSWYVFNIWTLDAYGNMATGTEVAIKTYATIRNESLVFVNPRTEGPATNVAVARPENEWIFRATVSEVNGYFALNNVNLRLADQGDASTPYSDLVFTWNQTGSVFTETGSDPLGAATLATSSTASCADNSCEIDFHVVFNKNFLATSTEYAAELYSMNDGSTSDEDVYADFYQVRYPYVTQTHYRWRNDDGGE